MKKLLVFIFTLSIAFQASASKDYDRDAVLQPITNEIYPFTTDGCSRFPDTLFGDPKWLICCEVHDVAYWAGVGGEKGRSKADAELFACVSKKTKGALGALMWTGVRAATLQNTSRWFPSEYRWGYGWPFALGTHIPLNTSQLESIRANLSTVIPAVVARRQHFKFPALTRDERQELAGRIKRLFWEMNDLD